ncbi:MAG: cupin domain-containing protein [Candidatus Omnitrophica bacterium]|nr:cupin domain-containing protein [Candidatus Omnitrophota bacterium]
MIPVKKLDKKVDERGWFAEIFKDEIMGTQNFGLVYVTTANPGKVKGNHYHEKKKEWVTIIQGKALFAFEDIRTGEKKEMIVSDGELIVMEFQPFIAHAVKNIGNGLLIYLAYTHKAFDPKNPDTKMYKVIE